MPLKSESASLTVPPPVLAQVIGRSEQVQELVEQSAEELSAAGSALKQGVLDGNPLAGVDRVLHEMATVTKTLHDASVSLGAVNQALQVEARHRTMVDHQLAAAVEQEEGSRRAALHDPLTRLPNRMLFRDRLEHGIAQAQRHRWILAVMFVDLDKFKQINDTYGHEVGDVVLQTVALRLAHSTRSNDTVSRYGGDEFLCVLTPVHELKDIAVIGAKVRTAIQAPCAVPVGDVTINLIVAASIGISVYPRDGDTAAGLIARADDAMYAAKEHPSGIAFAQEKSAQSAAPHRGLKGGRLTFGDAPTTRLSDIES